MERNNDLQVHQLTGCIVGSAGYQLLIFTAWRIATLLIDLVFLDNRMKTENGEPSSLSAMFASYDYCINFHSAAPRAINGAIALYAVGLVYINLQHGTSNPTTFLPDRKVIGKSLIG